MSTTKKFYVLCSMFYVLFLFLLLPQLVFATQAKIQIPIPGFQPSETLAKPDSETGLIPVDLLPQYIAAVYSYLVGFASLFATALVMYGGMKWIFAGGDSGKITKAKEVIQHALIGLVLALGSYLVLFTLNPKLTKFEGLKIRSVERQILEGEHGGNEIRLSAQGQGEAQSFRTQSCDSLAAGGQTFNAYFTTYFKPAYGDDSGYGPPRDISCAGCGNANPGATVPSIEPTTGTSWGFFCATAMECSCPNGKDTTKRCYSSGKWAPDGERHGWFPCAPFDASIRYCESAAGGSLVPGQTVAGDKDCFSHYTGQCEIIVDGSMHLKITDSGSGIRGKRFDLWTGTRNTSTGIESGVHSVEVVPGTCRQVRPYRGGAP